MFAVIKSGGKQHIVIEGQVLTTEKIELEVGQPIEFEMLLLSDEAGEKTEVGKPVLEKKVQATIVAHGMGKKVSIVKYKAKSRYRRHTGHRQPFTKVKIEKLG